jgi:nitrous oxide reductase accessory protein NosL
MWVVRADIVTPMSGGFAAFRDRAAADAVAAERSGRVGRLGEFAREVPR